jgi:thiol-disulfide isomerase/thioredoxin
MSFYWILAITLTASSGTVGQKPSSQVGTKAPMIASPQWINTEPLGSKDFGGKVLLVQFWTFGSVDCMRTVPAMRKLRKLLPTSEVMVVGVHTPESDHEKELPHLRDAIRSLEIDYPVAVDNDRVIWKGFRNRSWPALYVVDGRGVIRYVHAGDLREHTARWDTLLEMISRLRKEVP